MCHKTTKLHIINISTNERIGIVYEPIQKGTFFAKQISNL